MAGYDIEGANLRLRNLITGGNIDTAIRLYNNVIAEGADPSLLVNPSAGINVGGGTGTPSQPAAPAAPAAPPGPASVGGLTPEQLNTQAIITATLRQYGLDTPELLAWARQSIVNGSTADQINLEIYDPSSTVGNVVDVMYPGIRLRREAGLPPVSISEYQSLRSTYQQILERAGLTSFVDVKDLTDKWVAGNTSPAEAADRVGAAQAAVFTEPPEVRAELQRLFGVGDSMGAATHYYLEGDKALPKIMQELTAAEIGGASVRTGFGLLTADEAMQLVQQGVTADQAQQGLAQLGARRELFSPLPGEGGAAITTDEQLAAQFGGNITAQEAIQRRQAERRARFAGGGSFGATQRGMTGLGVGEGA